MYAIAEMLLELSFYNDIPHNGKKTSLLVLKVKYGLDLILNDMLIVFWKLYEPGKNLL